MTSFLAARRATSTVAQLALRQAGRVIPLPVLWVLLWPLAFLKTVLGLATRPGLLEHRAKAASLLAPDRRLPSLLTVLCCKADANLAKLLFLWPERLVSRCQTPSGTPHLDGRPAGSVD